MNDAIIQLAMMLKDRDNKEGVGIGIGVVVDPLPDIKVKFGEHIVLQREDIVVAAGLTQDGAGVVEIAGVEYPVKREIVAGDQVILIPTPDNQQWYLIDKVVP
ncbi:DUF2577 family protein [Cohnella cholangitidis]|uniref:DUF2577 domain-containing protein n=1 Tax=Cohnella cholangitidis TaxID=2598458 RepID=A0A7G5C3G3_9BACL|nr:DUF2577 family protein [Cohnella cholangitidis]QMV43747.1 DUF2577 domain-containing protein [Cohnella cholangitidis]